MEICHQTITIDYPMKSTPERVFSAYIDDKAKQVWCAPSDEFGFKVVKSDIRSGGTEIDRCGPKNGEMTWEMRISYHIVQEPSLILFTEELWNGETLITVALITLEITPDGAGSIVKLTDQVTSFAGQKMIDDHQSGYEIALSNLDKFCGK